MSKGWEEMETKITLERSKPLYYQIKEILKRQILEGDIKPKEPIPSLPKIAQNFGVSIITARQAVKSLIDEGLLYVVTGKGTFVADRPLKKVAIGIALDFDIDLTQDIPINQTLLIHFKEWLDYLSIESSNNNCLLINIPSALNKEDLIHFVKENSISGIVVLGTQNTEKITELNREIGIPYVILGEIVRNVPETKNFVTFNNYAGAVKAAQYVVDKGYRRIGILIGTLSYYGYVERLKGYKDVFSRNMIPPEDVIEIHSHPGVEGGYKATKELLSSGNIPTAILCTSDFKALGAVRAIKEHGFRVPEDIAIVGYDGLVLKKEEYPSLTTVRIPKREMIKEGINFLLKANQLPSERLVIQKEIEPELIIGNTA